MLSFGKKSLQKILLATNEQRLNCEDSVGE